MNSVIETRIVYFPPYSDKPKTLFAKDLEDAQALIKDMELVDVAPIIEQRTITYAEWEIVENPSVNDA